VRLADFFEIVAAIESFWLKVARLPPSVTVA
jgi:hypothetical protein